LLGEDKGLDEEHADDEQDHQRFGRDAIGRHFLKNTHDTPGKEDAQREPKPGDVQKKLR
jgi:hypothetical protein